MLFVPLPPVAGGTFSQRARLGERDYILRFRHNSRVDTWALDIDVVGEAGATSPVMTGKKLFCGHDLLRQCFEATRPPGRLGVIGFDLTAQTPSATNLARFRLVYLEPGETLGAS